MTAFLWSSELTLRQMPIEITLADFCDPLLFMVPKRN